MAKATGIGGVFFRAADIPVETRADWDGDGSYGHFARVHDPKGNPVELWEAPKG